MHSTQTSAGTAVRGLTAAEINTVAGGLYAPYEPLGDRSVVGCGTMVLLDRLMKKFFPR